MRSLSQLQQEALQLFDQRLFDFAFLKVACVRQTKKLQYHGVPNEISRTGLYLLDVGGRFLFERAVISTGQEALVVQRIDLAFQGTA